MKCMQVWAFSASFFKMVLWVLMLGKCPSKYTMNLVGGFYMRFNVLGPNCTRAPPSPTDHIVEETVFIQVDLVEQLVIEIHGRNKFVYKRMDCKISWMRSGMVEKDNPPVCRWRNAWSETLDSHSSHHPTNQRVAPDSPGSGLRVPPTRDASAVVSFPYGTLRSRALQIVESIVEICIANSAIHAHECGRCSSFEWVLMHLQCGAPSKLLFR
jgi:hypothetical protein